MSQTKTLRFIKFGAPWCGYCQAMDKAKFLERVARDNPDVDVRRVDLPTDEEATTKHTVLEKKALQLAKDYKVQALPVLVVEDLEGNVLERVDGAMPFKEVAELLDSARDKLKRKLAGEDEDDEDEEEDDDE